MGTHLTFEHFEPELRLYPDLSSINLNYYFTDYHKLVHRCITDVFTTLPSTLSSRFKIGGNAQDKRALDLGKENETTKRSAILKEKKQLENNLELRKKAVNFDSS